jgi:capsular exopolysaccharide synthesis family protein
MIQPDELSETLAVPQWSPHSGRSSPDGYETLLSSLASIETGLLPGELTVGVTSCLHGDGGSTVALNLAACAAAVTGSRVLLVGANMASPMLHHAFRLKASPGLANLLSGEADLVSCVQPTQAENLLVITAGIAVRRWLRWWGRRKPAELLGELEREFPLIVVDLPPVAESRKSPQLATLLDTVLLVIEAGRTRASDAQHAQDWLMGAGVHVGGVVVNEDRRPVSYRPHGNGRH